MFFNKLREEIKEYLKDRVAFFAEIYTKDVIKGLKATYKTLEELIAKYKHTKWEKLTPFEADILIDRFDLVPLMGGLAIYKGSKITFADWHYVGDTLIKVKERQEEKYISNPPATDKDKLKTISAIVKNQKSTVKAVSLIINIWKVNRKQFINQC